MRLLERIMRDAPVVVWIVAAVAPIAAAYLVIRWAR